MPSTSQRTKKPGIGIEYALGGLNYAGRNNYGLHWEISFLCYCESRVVVLCTVLTPVHSTRYPILGCQQQEAEVGGGGGGGSSSSDDGCYCVIVHSVS